MTIYKYIGTQNVDEDVWFAGTANLYAYHGARDLDWNLRYKERKLISKEINIVDVVVKVIQPATIRKGGV